MPTSRAATPEVLTLEPSGPITSMSWSLSVTPRIQRSSSDMILESDTEATPPPGSDKGVLGENTVLDVKPPEREPPTEPTSEPQTEISTVDFHEKQMMGETPIPPVQDPSLASPRTKRNPFTESRTFLHPPCTLPPLVRSTAIPDVGRLSLHSPTVYDALNRDSTVASRIPRQKSSVQKTYIFSAAEIRTLVALRGSDEGSGLNKLEFYLDLGLMSGITKWRNFKSGQG